MQYSYLHMYMILRFIGLMCSIRCSIHGMTLTDHFIGLNNCTDCSVISILGLAKHLYSVYCSWNN